MNRRENPVEGKWEATAVRGANPNIFINELCEFKNKRYSVKGSSLSGKYELGTDGNRNTIMLFPDIRTDVDIAGIYEILEDGKKLIMKSGNTENDMPNFPRDFTEDNAWYDVYVCEKR